MNLRSCLFSKRRWMLWLPLPVAALMASPDFQLAHYVALLVGGLIFWIPFWLAWWLSDGFRTAHSSMSNAWLEYPYDTSNHNPYSKSNDTVELYYNYAEGHYQSYWGPSSYRV